MKRHTLRFLGSGFALLLGLSAAAYGDVPSMDVTVFDAGGKVAFKSPMSANATFATPNLRAGNYVVQFNTRSGVARDNLYLLVVSAGTKKMIADAVPGEQFIAGGAAMKVHVGAGLRITGQVANAQAMVGAGVPKFRVINGTRFVWVTAELGRNLGGHWVEEGVPPAGNVVRWRTDDIRKRQDRSGEGNAISYAHHHPTERPEGY